MNPRLQEIQKQLLDRWQQMDRMQRIFALALAVGAIASLVVVGIWSSTPDYAVVYTGLTESDAANIVKKLKDGSIPYQLSDGGTTIKVPTAQVYDVRLSVARDGLAQGGVVGFELFNNPSLAMTDFTQQLNYQRALEGELDRTIGSISAIESARVHMVIPQPTLYTQDKKSPTASIIVKLRAGQRLNAGQVEAITNLVAGSVEGLQPQNITLVDTAGNMLTSGAFAAGDGPDTKVTATQQQAQRDLETQTAGNLEDMLNKVLGPNRAVVRVNATMNWDKLEVSTEAFAPTGTVGSLVRSSHLLSETSPSGSQAGGIPGVASNVPTYQATLSGTNSVSGTVASALPYQRLESTINYDLSKTTSKRVATPGKVERLLVSVIVDGITNTVQLASLKDSVSAAVGADPARGDLVNVSSATFDHTYYQQELKSMDDTRQQDLIFSVGKGVLLGLGALVMFIFMRRTFLGLAQSRVVLPIIVERPETPMLSSSEAGPALAGIGQPSVMGALNAGSAEKQQKQQLQAQLGQLARQRPEALAQVIEQWLKEDDK